LIIYTHIIEHGIGSVLYPLLSKKEYDDTLSRYTQKRSEANLLEKEISSLKAEIEALRLRLANPLPPPSNPTNTNQSVLPLLQTEHQDLQNRYQALVHQLHSLEAESAERVAGCSRVLQMHQHTLSEIENKRKSTVLTIDNSQT
jgi:peptidoglycan hydrolase CwlO-like protein